MLGIQFTSAELLTGPAAWLWLSRSSQQLAVPFPSLVVIVWTGRGLGPRDGEILWRTSVL
ncbi:hypothetical protein I79_007655 [Cricetulus griseus]|uniref:Uncharacterized protein n=1 Tax=Cricetulus griseus TaxID=10029 RepID=G3HB40_CRIGR|nr:hypothetical protein I79_007655 [Cricetulus griseus]